MSENYETSMTIIDPEFEIVPAPDVFDRPSVFRHIERIGRVYDKSEDQITSDSCFSFANTLKENGHWAMLEHFWFVMRIPSVVADVIDQQIHSYSALNPRVGLMWNYINMTDTFDDKDHGRSVILSGSATGFNNLFREIHVAFEIHDKDPAENWDAALMPIANNLIELIQSNRVSPAGGIFRVLVFLIQTYPELIINPFTDEKPEQFDLGIEFLSREKIEALPIQARQIHMTETIKFTCDRGFANELERHRPPSYAQESTRYCNYMKRGYLAVSPAWVQNGLPNLRSDITTQDAVDAYNDALEYAFAAYDKLISMGLTPQDARGVLPLATKTEIYVTTNLAEWKYIFKLRDDKSAHPDMQRLMVILHAMMTDRQPLIFDEQKGV